MTATICLNMNLAMYLESLFLFPGAPRAGYGVHVSAHSQCARPLRAMAILAAWLVSAPYLH